MRTTIIIAVLLIIIRIWFGFIEEPETFTWFQAFKDTAHLFMGGLAVAWWIKRLDWQWYTFWILNIVEVAVAVLTRL